MYFDHTQHRYIPYKDSLLLECKSYSFEAYPKYRQMNILKKKNTETGLGIARLELRASKYKIQQLAKKYHLPSPEDNLNAFLARSPEITRNEIPYVMSKMAGSGSFYDYSYIIDKIQHSEYTTKSKEYMTQIANYISRHKSCKNLFDETLFTRSKWNAALEKFNDLGCSPIPVPRTYKFHRYPGVNDWKTLELSDK